MLVGYHKDSPWQEWRPGVRSRAWSSPSTGAAVAHMGEQIVAPGAGAPDHWHHYEEHFCIYAGTAEVRVAGEVQVVEAPATVIFPPETVHGFTNVGDIDLHIIGAVPYPIHETFFVDDPAGTVTRSWEPGIHGHRKVSVEAES